MKGAARAESGRVGLETFEDFSIKLSLFELELFMFSGSKRTGVEDARKTAP